MLFIFHSRAAERRAPVSNTPPHPSSRDRVLNIMKPLYQPRVQKRTELWPQVSRLLDFFMGKLMLHVTCNL